MAAAGLSALPPHLSTSGIPTPKLGSVSQSGRAREQGCRQLRLGLGLLEACGLSCHRAFHRFREPVLSFCRAEGSRADSGRFPCCLHWMPTFCRHQLRKQAATSPGLFVFPKGVL